VANEYDLIINDGDCKHAAFMVRDLCDMMAEAIQYYAKIMRYVLDDAVNTEATAALEHIMLKVENLPELLYSMSKYAHSDINKFLAAIDEADSFLF
jgi:hypothetical protein